MSTGLLEMYKKSHGETNISPLLGKFEVEGKEGLPQFLIKSCAFHKK